MVEIKARAQLIQNFQIALDDGESHGLIVDLPQDLGTNLGPTSLELCVMSHAGCYATILALTAKKMRISLKGLTVEVKAVKTEEAGTITEEAFRIRINADAPPDRIERLHKLTLENCPVGIIFEKAGTKITYEVETIKD